MISQQKQQKYKIKSRQVSPTQISITIINTQSSATYHLQKYILTKISAQTISVASKKQNKNISYVIQQKQSELYFQVVVQVQYLPRISQVLILALIQAKQVQAAIYDEIRGDVKQLQDKLNYFLKQKSHLIRQTSGKNGQIFRQNLQNGIYLLQFSAIVTNSYLEDECNDYDYDGLNYFIPHPISITITVQSLVNDKQNILKKIYPQIVNKYQQMEYPIAINCPLEINEPSTIIVNTVTTISNNIIVNSAILSITKAIRA